MGEEKNLGLRGEAVEQLQRAHGPLVVDDILMNFDDQRAASTLQLLDNLASQTQILFFTHHQHTLELARQQLPPERVHLHTLG